MSRSFGRLTRRGALVALAGGGLAAGLGIAAAKSRRTAPPVDATRILVSASPIPNLVRGASTSRVGRLDYLGGLVLTADDPRFGGLSGLSLTADRALLALSDRGFWLSARVVMQDGRPSGLADALIAPILGPDGRPLAGTRRFDTESLCVAGDVAYVGIERVHEVLRFALGRDGLGARGEPLSMPAQARNLPKNRSLEAVAVLPAGPYAGSVIAISERAEEGDDTPTRGFFITGPRGGFTVRRQDGFDITDAAALPDGDLLLLERRFSWLSGVAMRLRRVPGPSIRPGAELDGEELVRLGAGALAGAEIDNMEGLAVHRDARGLVLTLVSDDNFSMLQRTILLQFRLADLSAQRAG